MQELLWALGGLALGAAVTSLVFVLRGAARAKRESEYQSRAEVLREQAEDLAAQLQKLRDDRESINARRETAERKIAVLESEIASRDERLEQEKSLREEMEQRLKDTFRSIGSDALLSNNKQFLELARKTFERLMTEAKGDVEKKQQAIDSMVKPIRELLDKHNTAVSELEKKREVAYSRLEKQIEYIAQSHEKLNTETGKLVSALRRPEQRGRWGEMQLRNAVELAGMSKHCDFDEQVSVWRGDNGQRPDMVVNLPGGGVIVIDSKVAVDAYLDGLETGADRDTCLQRHCRQVESHFKGLAKKEYWNQFDRTPKLVVMFMPLESALTAALEVNPNLHNDAMKNHVLIATPTLLVALLRAVAYGWQQDAIAENAREISLVGKELYERIAKFVGDFENLGTHLTRATNAYNTAVGSFDRRITPSVRKLKELHVTTDDDVDPPSQIDVEARNLDGSEFKLLSE